MMTDGKNKSTVDDDDAVWSVKLKRYILPSNKKSDSYWRYDWQQKQTLSSLKRKI